MKNINLTILLLIILLGCGDDEENNPPEPIIYEPSIYGTWILDSLKVLASPLVIEREGLRDFNLSEWGFMELIFGEYHNDDTLILTTNHSPDYNIFPPSSLWALELSFENTVTFENTQKFIGDVEGYALGCVGVVGFRCYYVILLTENELKIRVTVEPDCPVPIDCPLAIGVCCDVLFFFEKKE